MRFETKYIAVLKNISYFQIYRCKKFWWNTLISNCHICIYNPYVYLYLQLYFNYGVYIYLAIHAFDMHSNLGDIIWGKQAQLLNLHWTYLHTLLSPLFNQTLEPYWALTKVGAKGQNIDVHFNPATFYVSPWFFPQVKTWRLIKVIWIHQISFVAKASFEGSLHCLLI